MLSQLGFQPSVAARAKHFYLTRRPQPQSSSPEHSHFQIDRDAPLWSHPPPDYAALNVHLRQLNANKCRNSCQGRVAQSLGS